MLVTFINPRIRYARAALMRRAVAILASNPLSLLGLILIGIILICAVFADFIAPFPEHRGAVVDFANFNQRAQVAAPHGDRSGRPRSLQAASSTPTGYR